MPFEIYKRGQGRAARTATAVSLLAVAAFGCISLKNHLSTYEALRRGPDLGAVRLQIAAIVAVVVFLGCAAAVGWMLAGWRRCVDFLILTESELRKVSWPSRSELRQQTAVVIVTAVLFGVFICVADVVLKQLLDWIGIL